MKTKKKINKKNLIISSVLIVAVLITGLFAFLSITDEKNNTFTVGNVDVTVYQDDWFTHNRTQVLLYDENSNNINDKAECLVCGDKLEKTPYMVNEGTNDAWVYMSIGIPTLDVDMLTGSGEEMRAIENTAASVKVTGYAVQDKLFDNEVNAEDTLLDTWNFFKANNTNSFPSTTTTTPGNEMISVTGLDTTHWTLVETINSAVDENLVDHQGEQIYDEEGNALTAKYNYYIYGYKQLLLGSKNYKEVNGSDPVLIVTPDTSITQKGLQYCGEYDESICTTPLFNGIKLANVGAREWKLKSGASYASYYYYDSSRDSYFTMDNTKATHFYHPGKEYKLSNNATLTFDFVNENDKNYVVPKITLADGNIITVNYVNQFNSKLKGYAGNGYHVLSDIFSHTDYIYKFTDIYFGDISYFMKPGRDHGNVPNISFICYQPGTNYFEGVTLVFDRIIYKGVTYDINIYNTITSQYTPYGIKLNNSLSTPIYTFSNSTNAKIEFQAWFEKCINTGTLIGDFPWLEN